MSTTEENSPEQLEEDVELLEDSEGEPDASTEDTAAAATNGNKTPESAKKQGRLQIPNVNEFTNERRYDRKARTVMVGRVTMEMLQADVFQAHIRAASYLNLILGTSTEGRPTTDISGVLELRFGTEAEAETAAEELNQLEEVTAMHAKQLEKVNKDFVDKGETYKTGNLFRKEHGCEYLNYEGATGKRTVAITGVDEDMSFDDIRDAFPTAVDVLWPSSFVTGQKESYVYAEFTTVEEAEKMNKTKVTIGEHEFTCNTLTWMPSRENLVASIKRLNLGERTTFDAKATQQLHEIKSYIFHYLHVEYISDDDKKELRKYLGQITRIFKRKNNKRTLSQSDGSGGKKARQQQQQRGGTWGRGGGGSRGRGMQMWGPGASMRGYGYPRPSTPYSHPGAGYGSSIYPDEVDSAMHLLAGLKDMFGPRGGSSGGGRGGYRGSMGSSRGTRGLMSMARGRRTGSSAYY